MAAGLQVGVVASFDAQRGRGVVEVTPSPQGGRLPGASARYPFHCTSIAGGTRTIEPGTPVCFVVVAAVGGGREAREVTATGPGGS